MAAGRRSAKWVSRTEPIGWSDLGEAIQRRTAKALARERHISDELAADVVCSAAMRLISRKVIPRNVESLLLTTARNVLTDERRRQARERQHYSVAYSLDSPDQPAVAEPRTSYQSEPVNRVAAAEHLGRQLQKLWGSLKDLSERDRLILSAFLFEERGPMAIDGLLGMAPGTAKDRIFHARERLRGVLSGSNGRDEHNP